MTELPAFGKITFDGKDLKTPPLRYDKLALSREGSILLLSVVAEANYVKAIRAVVNGGAKATITATEGKVSRPDRPHSVATNPERCLVTAEGYLTYLHRLEYGLVHALFLSKADGFMPAYGEEVLWRELLKDRFTTPILREWLPYIRDTLYERDLLRFADSFRCRCGILSANTDQLDEVVTAGIHNGLISVPN